MEKPVEIEILGHKAKIVSVRGQLADGIWYKEDLFMVQINCDEGQEFEHISGIFVDLPVKNYGAQEFVQAVKDKAEKQVPEMLAKDQTEQGKRDAEKRRQGDLNSIASQIETIIQERRLM